MRTQLQIPISRGTSAKGSPACTSWRTLLRSASGTGPETAPPIVHDVLRSPGQPLDRETRAFMEPRFGHDFSKVRLHTDKQAAESARAVDARAYAVGDDIVFADRASGSEGTRLMAHELAHVVQQGGGRSAGASLEVGATDSAQEREADRSADAVARGQQPAKALIAAASVQRDAEKQQSAPPGPRGAQKYPAADRNDYYVLYQLVLQGTTGKSDLKSAQQKADLAERVTDSAMKEVMRHGTAIDCAEKGAPEGSKDMFRIVLPLSAQWGDFFKSALQTTAGGEYEAPGQPVKLASDIADQAMLSSGQLDQKLWDIYMNCKRGTPQAGAGPKPGAVPNQGKNPSPSPSQGANK